MSPESGPRDGANAHAAVLAGAQPGGRESAVHRSLDVRLRMHVATLDRTITFTRHADTKAAPLLALNATLAVATVAQTDQLHQALVADGVSLISALAWACLLSYAFLTVFSTVLAIRVFIPATPRTGNSIVYFEDIRAMGRDDFIYLGTRDPDDGLELDILTQIHAVSGIASRKFRWLRHSFVASLCALGFWLPLVVLTRL